jgi:hypothetical protein
VIPHPQTTPVTPDLIRGPAFLCGLSPRGNVAEGSPAPDQVRGDDVGEVSLVRAFAPSHESISFEVSREAAKSRKIEREAAE